MLMCLLFFEVLSGESSNWKKLCIKYNDKILENTYWNDHILLQIKY